MIRPARLVTVGSIVADVSLDVPHLPARGGDVISTPATISAGGGFNVLAAASRNGLSALYAGVHGTGSFGERIRGDLAREGIALLRQPGTEGDSGFCLVLIEPDGERTFVTSPGIAWTPDPSCTDLPVTPDDALLVTGYDLCDPSLGAWIVEAVPRLLEPVLMVFDPSPLIADVPAAMLDAVLRRTDVLTLNRAEAACLAGVEDPEKALPRLAARLAPTALTILRRGAAGCLLAGVALGAAPIALAAPRVRMVDATGAGDAHTGLFLAGLAQGLDAIAAARRANAGAALAVTRRGPATAPTAAELDQFLAMPFGRAPVQASEEAHQVSDIEPL